MMKRFGFVSLLLLTILFSTAQQVTLKAGMTIDKSMTIKKGVYLLRGNGGVVGFNEVISVQGENIVIDFNGSEMVGAAPGTSPDLFEGVGIYIGASSKVTIKNLKARGYKIAIVASSVDELILENCDFSYNYRPRLNSTQEKEDMSDWLSYHNNEAGEWAQKGAAIYLNNCNAPVIRNCRVTGGFNALMMTKCDNGKIYNNDFSFNSGVGIAMYRCNRNDVMYNRLNFNVRGYSHGVYSRGQDSAGILVYEQSSNNRFYKNSATHSGDGFFLWAGQSTMETGRGGCNDNLIMDNDFSYAPTNGIEVTFSRNKIIHNRILECDYGIWGGYSYESRISDNHLRNNRVGIAIEHGQQNFLGYNVFYNNKEGIRLWAREQQPADWKYPTLRDTRSAGYTISRNVFNNHGIGIYARRTDSILLVENRFTATDDTLNIDASVTNVEAELGAADEELLTDTPRLSNPNDPFAGQGKFAGRKNIRMTQWGPYDFQYPLLWNTNPVAKSDTLDFEVLGPAGKWKLLNKKGVKWMSQTTGTVPGLLRAVVDTGAGSDVLINLEYRGAVVTTVFGQKVTSGKSVPFQFARFRSPVEWAVRWFSVDTTFFNPLKGEGLFAPNVRMAPVKEETAGTIDYAWWGGLHVADQRYPQFLTVAEGRGTFAKGQYELAVTWDDAVRVYVDGKMVVDEWEPGRYKFDTAPNRRFRLYLGGNHEFRIEHVELGGFATVGFKIEPVRP